MNLTYTIKDMYENLSIRDLKGIDKIFQSGPKKIPLWIWWPIMMCESKGDYTTVFYGNKDNPEHSIGLFQINLIAKEIGNKEAWSRIANTWFYNEMKGNKRSDRDDTIKSLTIRLKDPYKNAEIARSGWIGDYMYPKSHNVNTPSKAVLFDVYKNGIRPRWNKTLEDRAGKYFNYVTKTDILSLGGSAGKFKGNSSGSNYDSDTSDIPYESISGFTFARGTGPKSTSNLFTMDYNINEIQESLDKLYSKAPDIIKRRGNRIRETIKNLSIFISQHYIKED